LFQEAVQPDAETCFHGRFSLTIHVQDDQAVRIELDSSESKKIEPILRQA